MILLTCSKCRPDQIRLPLCPVHKIQNSLSLFVCKNFLEIVAFYGIKIEWSWSTDLGWYRNIGIKGLCQHPKVCKVWNFKLCPTFSSYSVLDFNGYFLALLWCRCYLASNFQTYKIHLVSNFQMCKLSIFPRTISSSYVSGLSRAGMWCAVCGRCPQWAQPPASPRSPHPPFFILLLVRHWRRDAEQGLTKQCTSLMCGHVNDVIHT